MKKRRSTQIILMLTMLLCLAFCTVSTQAATTATSTNKTTVKNGWKKESAGWCYYVKGKKLTSQLIQTIIPIPRNKNSRTTAIAVST